MKEGWTYKKLGEVGTFTRGGGFLKKDYVENGIPCIHYGQIHTVLGTVTKKHLTSIPESLRSKTRFATKGDIIFAITSEDVEGSCKCTAWLGDYDVAVGGHAAIYKHSLYPAFVSYFAKSPYFFKAKEKYVHGFKVMEIKPSDIAQIDIPVPSIEEQKRIVERLDSAYAHIDELKANAEKHLIEARALFQKCLTKAMEPKDGWEEKKLGNIAKICLGLTHTPKYTDSGVHFVSVKDISNGELNLKDTKFISKEEFDSMPSGAKPQKGDLLFCRVGTIGKPQILRTDIPFGIFVSVGFLRINNEVLTEYVKYWMDSPLFYKQVDENVQGSTLKNLNTGWLKNFIVPIPPQNKIKDIVSRLDSLSENVRKYEEIHRKVISECDALKQALLRKVFE